MSAYVHPDTKPMDTKPIILTWNLQGSNWAPLVRLLNVLKYPAVCLLQETGNADIATIKGGFWSSGASRAPKYKVLFVGQLDAKNPRCTTGILVREDIECELGVIEESPSRRPLLQANLKGLGLRVFTLHATAYARVAEKEVLEAITLIQKNYGDMPWIFGGDFNQSPVDLRAKAEALRALVSYPAEKTQKSGGTLDFFIHNGGVKGVEVISESYEGSDHLPVVAAVSL